MALESFVPSSEPFYSWGSFLFWEVAQPAGSSRSVSVVVRNVVNGATYRGPLALCAEWAEKENRCGG